VSSLLVILKTSDSISVVGHTVMKVELFPVPSRYGMMSNQRFSQKQEFRFVFRQHLKQV